MVDRPWHDGRLAAFDLETTSAEPTEARIVTAAIALCGGGQETETFTWLVDPGVEIEEGAAAVHGITTEHAREHGQDADQAIAQIATALIDAIEQGLPIVIFNARFDMTVMDRELRRRGYVANGADRLPDARIIDPLVIDKWLHRYRKGSRKLDAQAEHYGAQLDGAHDASFDAICAARVAWCIGKRGRVIRRVRNGGDVLELQQLEAEWERVRHDPGALHAAEQVWAREERARFAEYKRSQGEHELAAKILSEDWPLIPIREAAEVAA